MAQVYFDRIQETSSNTGTGTYTLLGAVTGYQSFAVVGNANTVYYCASNTSQWEVGNGTYVSANTALIRSTIIASSNSGNPVNWTSDTKTIFCDIPALVIANNTIINLSLYAPLASPTLTGTPAAPTAAAYTSTTQIATTAFATDAITKEGGINFQTGTTYTLAIGDAGHAVEMNNASTITVTVPNNATVAFNTNTWIDIIQYGAGQITIAAGGGVTIRSSNSKTKFTGQYSVATLLKRGTDEWYLFGDVSS